MRNTLTLFAALALAGTTALGGGLAANAADSKGSVDLKGLTCQKLLEYNDEALPRIIYLIDGYDRGGTETSIVTTSWIGAPVVDVVTECKRAPDRAAAEVVREQRETYKQ